MTGRWPRRIATLGVSLLFLAPLAFMVAGSLRRPGLPPPDGFELVPDPVHTGNYEDVTLFVPLWTYVRNSAIVVAVAVPLTVLVASWAGFAIATASRRTRRWLVALSLVCLMVPVSALWVPRFVMFEWAGILDTFVPLTLPALMATSPFYVLLFALVYVRVPRELYEAAALERLSPLAVWRKVAWPLGRPAAFAVAMLAFVFHWSNFVDPLLYLSEQSLYTVPLGLRSLHALEPTLHPVLLAASVIVTLPGVIAFFLAQRTFLTKTVLAAVLVGLFAACSPSAGGGDGGTTTIQLQVSGEPEETAVYSSIAEQFSEQNPDVEVEVVEIPEKDEHLARLATSFAGGNPPDVFLVNFREYSQFVVRGAIEPIESHLGDVDLDAYYEPPLEAFTYDGALQCMPQNISSLVVYYDKALFDEASLKRPKEGWSWEDFRQTALALTKGEVRGVGIEPTIIRLAPFAWSAGGDIVDDPEAPTRLDLDNAGAREALEFFVSLVRDDRVVPTEEEVAAQDLETRFTTGKLGMLLSSRRDVPAFREVQGLDFDVAPLPVADEPAGILHSDGYCIAAGSENVEAAAELVRFATGEEGETLGALSGRTVPSLKSVAESGAFLDPVQPPRHSEVFLEGIPYIRRTPVLSTWPEIEDVAEQILIRAFYEDGYTVDDAIGDLDSETRDLFEEALAE